MESFFFFDMENLSLFPENSLSDIEEEYRKINQIRILEWVAMPSSRGSSLQFLPATNQVSILSLALGWMNLGCFIRSIFTYKKAHRAYLQVPSLD